MQVVMFVPARPRYVQAPQLQHKCVNLCIYETVEYEVLVYRSRAASFSTGSKKQCHYFSYK